MKPEQSPLIQRALPIFKLFRSAFSTVEALLAVSIFGLLAVAFSSAYLYGQEATVFSGNEARAALFAEEGLEAARNMRDAAFSNLTDGSHGLAVSGNRWTWSGTTDTSGIFTRAVTVSAVDANRKNVVSTVTWQQNAQRTGTVSVTTRLTNWLAIGGPVDWATPVQLGAVALSGTQNGNKVQISGNYAYVMRSVSTAGNFLVYNISNPAAPSLSGTYNIVGTPNNIFVSGNYAYVTSNDATRKLQIVNISNPAAPVSAGNYTISNTYGGRGVFVSGNYAYVMMSGGANFTVINVSNPAAPTLAGSATITGTLAEVVVSGNYAYVASSSTSAEMQVVDVTNPAAPARVYTMNMSGTVAASSIAISGTTILIGRTTSVYAIDVTTPTAPVARGSIAIGGTVNDIALNFAYGGKHALIASANTAAEFRVVDITNPSTLTIAASVNYGASNSLLGIAYDTTLDRAVAVGNATGAGLVVYGP
jgi:hypothetical protein